MDKFNFLKYLLGIAVTAIGLFFALCVISLIMRPELSAEFREYSLEEIAETEELKDVSFDADNPVRIQKEVDYSEGSFAKWYPKEESPILTELVDEGELVPVAERVGEEPCVVEGVEGIGNYGGTWLRLTPSMENLENMVERCLGNSRLVRWSPCGYPIVPHIAKSFTVSDDNREFTFELRKGMRWSDGHPYTADDIMFWWEIAKAEMETGDSPPVIMRVGGKHGEVEKLGKYKVKFVFPEPNGLFLEKLTWIEGREVTERPAHYLRKYHHLLGDMDIIDKEMKTRNLLSRREVFRLRQDIFNPDCPRLWPWIYRSFKLSPPQEFVRNPYYWMVDTEGNQLPYIDRVMFDIKFSGMLDISAANGEVSMQSAHIKYNMYTHLMSQREKYGYEVYHWYPGKRSNYIIVPNMNLRIDSDRPETKKNMNCSMRNISVRRFHSRSTAKRLSRLNTTTRPNQRRLRQDWLLFSMIRSCTRLIPPMILTAPTSCLMKSV
jgi:ABC-type transport system substrate-binding protein